ncbi:MAG TPA: crossover junction endodeoxyribonuclease RuvC [Candidatus Paceibacterota bacterium]|nr:crossover junction endodeoxyribonuclease RuvC [Candidatus Paceibacterota bacterium]
MFKKSIITNKPVVVLGIDPGTVRIGYGIVRKDGSKLTRLESGLIELPKENHGRRLVSLEKNLNNLIRRFAPDKVGLERLFLSKNRKTAMEVAEARGVIIKTVFQNAVPLKEMGPNEVKLAVTGDGGADKKAVQKMVRLTLGIRGEKMIDDISDALAIAISAASNLDF